MDVLSRAMTPVFLLTENRLLREALVRILSKRVDVAVVGAVAFAPTVLDQMVASQAEVVLLDSPSLAFYGPRLVARIRQLLTPAKIVMIGMERDETTFFRAVRSGVMGYVLKDASALEIVNVVHAVCRCSKIMSPRNCNETLSPCKDVALIGAKPELADPAAILMKVAAAGDEAAMVLKSFNPPQKGYEALREKLAELRHVSVATARVMIPGGPELKVGMRDPRVSLIRARFGLDAEPPTNSEDLVYDTRVAAAVADFQKANGLPASGVLSARTIAALSGGQPLRLENEILANMERWRWMPRDMGESRIEVNVPDFTVSVIRAGEVVARNKVIVGNSKTPTPLFSNTMQFLIVNPSWNVPQSIIRKEMLPRLGQDPSYLQRLGYQVTRIHGLLFVRQPPGERNALGRIKFMFPNEYSVYLHDTPSRGLFGAAQRAFSHGCVRLDQPFAFAETVLGRDNGWSAERVKHLIGGRERYVYLPKPLPIHIEYFTAFVDGAGRLQLRNDIYGYSNRVKTALGLAN